MTSSTATLTGFAAILMWSLLSLLTVASGTVPPFQLAGMTFAIGGGIGAATWLFRPGAAAALKQPAEVWALGVGGLFGYHALFFLALRLAPPAEAQLVNYLWPVLIVLLSAFLPGERLRLHHFAGAMIALAGTVLLFVGRGGITFAQDYLPGFAAAFVAAFAGRLFGALAPLRRGVDRRGRGLLPRDLGARRNFPSRVRADAMAADPWPMARSCGVGHRSGRRRILRLGYRGQAR